MTTSNLSPFDLIIVGYCRVFPQQIAGIWFETSNLSPIHLILYTVGFYLILLPGIPPTDYRVITQPPIYHCLILDSTHRPPILEFRTHRAIPHRRMDQQAEIISDISRSSRVWSFTNLADCERYHLGSCEHAKLLLFCFILGHLGVDSGFYTAQPEHLQAEQPAEPPEQQEGSGA